MASRQCLRRIVLSQIGDGGDGWVVEVLGVLMFDHPSSELPAHHFALLAKKTGTQIVVDRKGSMIPTFKDQN